MEEVNKLKNLNLSQKDIRYICGALKLLLYMPVGYQLVKDYDIDYNAKLYTRLSVYFNN